MAPRQQTNLINRINVLTPVLSLFLTSLIVLNTFGVIGPTQSASISASGQDQPRNWSVGPTVVTNYFSNFGYDFIADLPPQADTEVDWINKKSYITVSVVFHNYGTETITNVMITDIQDATSYQFSGGKPKARVVERDMNLPDIPPGEYIIFPVTLEIDGTKINEQEYSVRVDLQGERNGEILSSWIEAYVEPYFVLYLDKVIVFITEGMEETMFFELSNTGYPAAVNQHDWSEFTCNLPDGSTTTLPKSTVTHKQLDFDGNELKILTPWESVGQKALRTLMWIFKPEQTLPSGTICTGEMSMSYGWFVEQDEFPGYAPLATSTFTFQPEIRFVDKECENWFPLNLLLILIIFASSLIASVIAKIRKNKTLNYTSLTLLLAGSVAWVLHIKNHYIIDDYICLDLSEIWIYLIIFIMVILILIYTTWNNKKTQTRK